MTTQQLDNDALLDLLSDAEGAERQAETGPFYPDRAITKHSLLAYAAKCRAQIKRYENGGAHAAVVSGVA